MYDRTLNDKRGELDWPLMVASFGLMVIGVLFVFSATSAVEIAKEMPWFQQTFAKQIIWCAAGCGAALALSKLDYVSLARWSTVIYWAMILCLIGVLVKGSAINGSKRWITLPLGFNFQPSEFAKIAFVLLQANFLSRPVEELRQTKTFWIALCLTLLPFVLILKEPDMGSALVFLSTSLVMMFVAGIPKRVLGTLVATTAVIVVLVAVATLMAPTRLQKIVTPYQQKRLRAFIGVEESYNVKQALISVGSGGFSGKGWRQGTQHSLGFLPRMGAHNDFIFSVIAEEEGFVGSVVILTLYTMLLFYGIKIASQARDRLGKLLAIGVVALLFSHVFINIGMNIRIMPVAGIPLPLVSYGGSSVVCSLIAIGLLHNVHIHRKSY